MKVYTYDNGLLISEVGEAETQLQIKSIYTISKFMNKLRPKYRELKAAAALDDGVDSDNIEFMLDNVNIMDNIDLNTVAEKHPWFVEGLVSAKDKGVFTITQLNNFLDL